MAPECIKVNKRMAEKHWEPYASVMTYIGTKLRFALLRSTVAAIQGFRGKQNNVNLQDLTDIRLGHDITNEILCFLELNTPLFNQLHFVFHVPNTYWITVYC